MPVLVVVVLVVAVAAVVADQWPKDNGADIKDMPANNAHAHKQTQRRVAFMLRTRARPVLRVRATSHNKRG